MKDEDASWYALRMAIFACGCQIELSKTQSFHEANETGWRYFENTLSVYTKILFYQTSIIGVQALVVMVSSKPTFFDLPIIEFPSPTIVQL